MCLFVFQSQAASQEALDQIKAANEANLRSQLEQKIREMEGELGRARTTQQDSLNQRESTRTELERYRQLYTEELRLRKSLAAKLERWDPIDLHSCKVWKTGWSVFNTCAVFWHKLCWRCLYQ